MSDAVRLLMHRVISDQAFPLELKVPNSETHIAMAQAEDIIQKHHARFSTSDTLFDDLKTNSRQ